MNITEEQQQEVNNATQCYICKKEIVLNDKKGCKVRDHNHYTGEYRGCAHKVCNLNYNYKDYKNTCVLSQPQKLRCPFNNKQRT